MKPTIESTIDAYVEPNTVWNAKAKKAWEHGDLSRVFDIICSYYQFIYEPENEL